MGYLRFRGEFLDVVEKKFKGRSNVLDKIREVILNDGVVEDFEGREFVQKFEGIVMNVKERFVNLNNEVDLEKGETDWLIDKFFVLVYAKYFLEFGVDGGIDRERRGLKRRERLMTNYMKNSARDVLYSSSEGENGEGRKF